MVVQDYHAMDVRDPDAVYQGSGRMGLKISCGITARADLVAMPMFQVRRIAP